MVDKTCEYAPCARSFVVKNNRALTARFCSRACYAESKIVKTFERFMARVDKTETCWLWRGAADGLGYGRIIVNRRIVLTHRYSYEAHTGPIPDSLVLDHLCRNPQCVNPAHLEAVTQRENMRRGMKVQQTHCKRGHALANDNLEAYRLNAYGHRICVQCALDRARIYRRDAKARRAELVRSVA